jgi:site-specific DNA recombinase
LVDKVELIASGIRVSFQVPLPVGAGESTGKILRASHFAPIKLKRRGVELRLILDRKDDLPRKPDPALLKAVARARRWFAEIASGQVRSFAKVARREGLQKGYVARLMRLAFLSPAIVDAVVEGRSRAVPNLQTLMTRPAALPLCWKDQERLFDGSDPHDTQSFKSIN